MTAPTRRWRSWLERWRRMRAWILVITVGLWALTFLVTAGSEIVVTIGELARDRAAKLTVSKASLAVDVLGCAALMWLVVALYRFRRAPRRISAQNLPVRPPATVKEVLWEFVVSIALVSIFLRVGLKMRQVQAGIGSTQWWHETLELWKIFVLGVILTGGDPFYAWRRRRPPGGLGGSG